MIQVLPECVPHAGPSTSDISEMFPLDINGSKGNHSVLKIFYNKNSISDHKNNIHSEIYVFSALYFCIGRSPV